MGLVKVNDCRFLNDNSQAQRAAREQLKIITMNLSKLEKIRNAAKYIQAVQDFNATKINFTPKQLSFIDVIYEKTMKGAGFESFAVTYKP